MANSGAHGDFSKLNRFAMSLSDKKVVRIGLLGKKGAKSRKESEGTTNAEVGMAMELGVRTKNIPPRSWLRMPLLFKGDWILKGVVKGAEQLLGEGKKLLLMKRLGIKCEEAIQTAFDSGGFGKWAKLSKGTIERKGSSAILIDTSQLRRAVSSDVGPPS